MNRPRTPLLAVDIVIEVSGRIVLVERKNPPPGWALPGGFVEYGETLEAAAVREAREETGLTPELLEQFHAYSDPARDRRSHVVSVVFLARGSGVPHGADDARRAALFAPSTPPSPLCFDHAQILADYLEYRRRGRRPPPRVARAT